VVPKECEDLKDRYRELRTMLPREKKIQNGMGLGISEVYRLIERGMDIG
jgi:hypothetical protein